MQKASKIFLQFFTVFCLFSSCFLKEINIDYPTTTKDTQEEVKEPVIYTVKLSSKLTKWYVKISAIPGDIQNQWNNVELLSGVNKTNLSRDKAEYFSDKYQGTNILYVHKDKLNRQGHFYIKATCYLEQCSFNLTIEEIDYIDLSRNGDLNFFTPINGTINTFKIRRANDEDLDEEALMTVSISGSTKGISIKHFWLGPDLHTPIEYKKFQHGYLASFSEKDYTFNESNFYELVIESDPGEYITISSRTFKPDTWTSVPHVAANAPPVFGYFPKTLRESECFNVDPIASPGVSSNMYADFIVFSERAEIFFADELTGEEDPDMEKIQIYEQGSVDLNSAVEAGRLLCIRPSSGRSEVYFYMQITDFINKIKMNVFSPQLPGYIYSRHIPANGATFFTHITTKPDKGKEIKELNLSFKALQGVIKAFHVKCTTYPKCEYINLEEIEKKSKEDYENYTPIRSINGMGTYSLNTSDNDTSISNNQHILVIFCLAGNDCLFETSFFNDLDTMNIKKNDAFYQFLKSSDTDYYIAHIHEENKNLKKIIITLTVFDGNVNINFDNSTSQCYKKTNQIFAGNTQVYEFIPDSCKDDINFSIVCNLYSYYGIEYTELETEDEKTKLLDAGAALIQTIPGELKEKKTFEFINYRKKDKANYLVNFYSLNCKVKITREDGREIVANGLFAQDIIYPNEEYYAADTYKYTAVVTEMDKSVSKNSVCMIQISSLEMDPVKEIGDVNEREIAITAGYDYQVTFSNDYKEVKLLYPHTDYNGGVYLNFLIEEDKTEFNITILLEGVEIIKYLIGRSQVIYISPETITSSPICKNQGQPCPISIYVAPKEIYLNDKVNIRMSAKTLQTIATPIFLKRTQMKQDFIIENYKSYYYLEVGKGESGYITVNYNKGSQGEEGFYGKIFNIDKPDNTTGGRESWWGKFFIPTYYQAQTCLPFDIFTKKITFTSEDTKNCTTGCYIVVAVSNSMEGIGRDERHPRTYPISITVHEEEEPEKQTYIIDFPTNEYVVGSIDSSSELTNYFQYYTIDIQTDAHAIFIDFQSEVCQLYANIGETRPTSKKHDWAFPVSGTNTIYKILKTDPKFAEKGIESLKGIRLTFAIGTTYTDSAYTTLYGFRVRTPKGYPEIVNANSDDVALCTGSAINNCYFLINLKDEQSLVGKMILHAFSDSASDIKLFANIVESSKIDESDDKTIAQYLPTPEKCQYKSTDNYDHNYLILTPPTKNEDPTIQNQAYLIVGVSSSKDAIINFIYSYYKYYQQFYPNSLTKQIFLLESTAEKTETVTINLPPNKNYVLNFVSIEGKGDIIIPDQEGTGLSEYNLKGAGDRLSIIYKNYKNIKVLPLSNSFGFYLSYDVRPGENYDNIEYGQSKLMVLENQNGIEFPLIYYSKLNDQIPVDFSIDFKELIKKKTNDEQSSDDFEIQGIITDENTIMKKKINKYINPDMHDAKKGNFETSLQAGKIHFTKEDLDKVEESDIRYLYVTVNKKSNNNNSYSLLKLENLVLPSNSLDYIAPINKYNFVNMQGKDDLYHNYNLRSNFASSNLLRIEIAKNNENLDFVIKNPDTNEDKNITFIRDTNKEGRNVIDLKLEKENVILKVFPKNLDKVNDDIQNIVFRYQAYEEDSRPIEYKLSDPSIDYSYNSKKLTLKIKPVQRDDKNINATYYARVIAIEKAKEGQIYSSISFSDIDSNYVFSKEGTEKMDVIEMNIEKFPSEAERYYVTVFAMVDEDSKDILGYNMITIDEKNNDLNKKLWILVLSLSAAIVLLIIIFIIVCVYLKKQNKDLRAKAEKMSFRGDNKEDAKEGLLGVGQNDTIDSNRQSEKK